MKEKVEFYAYKPNGNWYVGEIFKLTSVCLVVAVLFYDRIWVAPLLIPFATYIWQRDRLQYKKRMQERLRLEFKEFIIILSGSLNAGYSLEQGIIKGYEELVKDHRFNIITKELILIINGISLNRNVEKLLMDMGVRCQDEMILEFGKLVATAKRYGGNINALIDKTKKKINDKLMVEKEIDTVISAKKLEGYIMLIMPFGIVLYMRLTNQAYISMLYQSGAGIVVATCGLLAVMGCGLLINKITEIEV